jgi:hypothetical protein
MAIVDTQATKVLVDNSVTSDADVAYTTTVPIPNMTNRMLILKARTKAKALWHQQEIECLPTIAALGMSGKILLHTDDIHREEYYRKPGSVGTVRFGYLFKGIKFQTTRSAVNRHAIFQLGPVNSKDEKKQLIEFCAWLLSDYTEDWLPSLSSMLNDHDVKSLSEISRFTRICENISQKHYDDAFQVWGGERNGLPFFLTTNRNFVEAVRHDRELKLLCKPLLPSELLATFGITPSVPMPYEYGQTYLLNGRRYDYQ